MSLKNKILYHLEKNGYMSLLELENLCKSEQYKLSNGERRLRELMATNPSIKPEKNPHGAIIGYRWQRFDVKKWNEQFYPKTQQDQEKVTENTLF